MESDIVERLREEGFITHMARLPRESKILHAAADEIERLRKERDEARRVACDIEAAYNRMMFDSPNQNDPVEIMKRRGWNKEYNS